MGQIQDEVDLTHLVYVSRITEEFSDQDLHAILCASQRNNLLLNITGILVYKNGRFMQFLEGSEFNVLKIFTVIKKDFRHHDIDVIRKKKILKRQYENWRMRLVNSDEILEHSGLIYKKLFEVNDKPEEVINLATESRALLLAFKNAC